VYVATADGTGKTRLTDDPAEDARPTWDVDSYRIVFQSGRDGDHDLYAVNRDATGLHALSADGVGEFAPSIAPAVPQVEPFPNDVEAGILAHIPERFRASCVREDPGTLALGAVAGVFCPTQGAIVVYYEQFETVEEMTAYYDSLVDSNGIPRGSGSCQGVDAAEDVYTQEQDGATVDAGRAACWRDENGNPTFVWTHAALRIAAYATRSDGGNLYDWWRSAGPF
jgi:hypothetical protein